MVSPVSGHLPLLPLLEPAPTASGRAASVGSLSPASASAEDSAAPGLDDPADAYMLAAAHYGDGSDRSGVTLASILSSLGSDGV